jgi:DMSO/TMAO reductase YedYZ molybdopterin-dependent catalytic subunit
MTFNINRRRLLKVVSVAGAFLITSGSLIYYFINREIKKENGMLPPGQYEVNELQVLHVGSIPTFEKKSWTFKVYGLVKNPFSLNYDQFKELPNVVSTSNFHCVTGWSKISNQWEGVRFSTIMEQANVEDNAKFATIECEYGYTTSLPIEDLSKDDVLLAHSLDGKELLPKHGGPLRVVIPHKYAYKSAKWVRKIKFTEDQELGYWEMRGYSNSADPFSDDRYS